jgi:glutathione S-transferase
VAAPNLALRGEGALDAGPQARTSRPSHAAPWTPPLEDQAPDRRYLDHALLTVKGCSTGDSSRIIALIEERWPHPPLYPEDPAQRRRALELEEFFDEDLGPHIRRAFYHELLPHPELVVPLFTRGQPSAARTLLRAGFPILRVAMRRRFEINANAAANSRAKMVAAIDRLEREISPSGYLVGDSFTVADLTAAALFYLVPRPAGFQYAMVADDDLPGSWREFLDSLAHRPGGQWLAEIYRRHRGASAELTPAKPARPRPDLAVAQGTR